MGVSLSTGPAVVSGPLGGTAGGTPADPNFYAGPGVTYQGDALPDIRQVVPLAAEKVGNIKAHQDTPYPHMCNYTPAAPGAATIAAAQNVTSGTAMTLVTAAGTGINGNVPVSPTIAASGGWAVVGTNYNCASIDIGFTKVVCVAANPVVTPTAGTTFYFQPGQQVIIPNGLTSTTPLITVVQSVQLLAGTITLLNAPGVSATLPISNANILDPLAYQLGGVATSYSPYLAAGVASLLNPLEGLGRGVSITGVSGGSGGNVTVRGFDIMGYPMTEIIAAPAGAGITYGKKAFKHVYSATPAFTDAHNYSIGTSDVFGFSIRSDYWEALNIFYNGTYQTVTTGWLGAVVTSPATGTTGDVRGTYQVDTTGGGTGAGLAAPNGTIRMSVYMSVPIMTLVMANPGYPDPFYGVSQYSA